VDAFAGHAVGAVTAVQHQLQGEHGTHVHPHAVEVLLLCAQLAAHGGHQAVRDGHRQVVGVEASRAAALRWGLGESHAVEATVRGRLDQALVGIPEPLWRVLVGQQVGVILQQLYRRAMRGVVACRGGLEVLDLLPGVGDRLPGLLCVKALCAVGWTCVGLEEHR